MHCGQLLQTPATVSSHHDGQCPQTVSQQTLPKVAFVKGQDKWPILSYQQNREICKTRIYNPSPGPTTCSPKPFPWMRSRIYLNVPTLGSLSQLWAHLANASAEMGRSLCGSGKWQDRLRVGRKLLWVLGTPRCSLGKWQNRSQNRSWSLGPRFPALIDSIPHVFRKQDPSVYKRLA